MFNKGLKDGIAIALGYLSVSFTFGLTAVDSGLAIWQAVLISMLCLTSAGQFAGLNTMITGGSYIEIILSQFIINLRYSLMSISLSQKTDDTMTLPVKAVTGFGITDEIFAVAMSRNKTVGKVYMYGLITLPYIGWAVGTLLGAIAGSIIPEILSVSLGIAIYGMFLAIIIPPATENKGIVLVIIVSIIGSSIIYYSPLSKVISSGFKVIIMGVLASAIGAYFFPVEDEDDTDVGGDGGGLPQNDLNEDGEEA